MIDHLVIGTPDLEAGARALEVLLDTSLSVGGPHLGLGTRNLLVGLGDGTYLELIGPDPEQSDPAGPRPFGIDDLVDTRLVAWCARPSRPLRDVVADVDGVGDLAAEPLLGSVLSMTRRRPDGVLLSWQLTATGRPDNHGGVVPFCIDWGSSEHPSIGLCRSVGRVRLTEHRLGYPQPEWLQRVLARIDDRWTTLALVEAGRPILAATLEVGGRSVTITSDAGLG
jgi:hypothetical protein